MGVVHRYQATVLWGRWLAVFFCIIAMGWEVGVGKSAAVAEWAVAILGQELPAWLTGFLLTAPGSLSLGQRLIESSIIDPLPHISCAGAADW